jgi:hypothetical protein
MVGYLEKKKASNGGYFILGNRHGKLSRTPNGSFITQTQLNVKRAGFAAYP